MNLFVYGELCKPAVLLEILGRVPPASPALLRGYRRDWNAATGYYRAVRHADAVVAGLVLEDIEEAELAALDRYENVSGGEYDRVEGDAECVGSGSSLQRVYLYAAVAAHPRAAD